MSAVTNPRHIYPYNWSVPWTTDQRHAVLKQYLKAADTVGKLHLERANNVTLTRFVELIVDDRVCTLLDYALVTRWISVLPFFCACRRAIQAGTATHEEIVELQMTIYRWLTKNWGPSTFGDNFRAELWFCVLKAVIREDILDSHPPEAQKEYSDPFVVQFMNEFDYSGSSEFKSYLTRWKLGWPSLLTRLSLLGKKLTK